MSRVNLTVRVVRTGPKIRLRYAFYAFDLIHKPSGVKLVLQAIATTGGRPDRTITQIVGGSPGQSATGKLELVFQEPDFEVEDQYVLVATEVEIASGAITVNANAYYTPLAANGQPGKPAVYPISTAVQFTSPVLNRQIEAIAGRRSELPRLIRGLNDAPVPEHPDAAAQDFAHGTASAIAFAARYVESRVRGGLAAVWAAEDQRIPGISLELSDLQRGAELFDLLRATSPHEFRHEDGALYSDAEMKRWVLEELWARLVAEMLCISPYSGAGIFYLDPMVGKPFISDAHVFAKASDPSDPAYPLGVACQHLCTMALIAGGVVTTGAPTQQMTAGSRCAGIMIALGDKWYATSAAPVNLPPFADPKDAIPQLEADSKLSTSAEALKILELGPGAVYLYSNHSAVPPPTIKTGRIGRDPGYELDHGLEQQKSSRRAGATSWIQDTRVVERDDLGKPIRIAGGGPNTPPKFQTKTVHSYTDCMIAGDGKEYFPDNSVHAHIGVVLRVDRRRKKLQCFDTGGLGNPERGKGVSLYLGSNTSGIAGGIFDDPPTDHVVGSGGAFRGIGVPPVLSDSQLHGALERQYKSRPLGFARFLLVRPIFDFWGIHSTNRREISTVAARVDDWLIYASPLIRMWGDSPEENYSRARMAWSLRQFPGREHVQGVWLVYAPSGALAVKAMEAGRGTRISDLIAAAGGPKSLSVSDYLAAHTKNVADMVSRLNGNAHVPFIFKATNDGQSSALREALKMLTKRAPWDAETGGPSGLSFFSGEWGTSSSVARTVPVEIILRLGDVVAHLGSGDSEAFLYVKGQPPYTADTECALVVVRATGEFHDPDEAPFAAAHHLTYVTSAAEPLHDFSALTSIQGSELSIEDRIAVINLLAGGDSDALALAAPETLFAGDNRDI